MKLWYCILLVAACAGGWFAYPHAYPAITAYLKDGTLPWAKDSDPLDDSGEEAESEVAVSTPATPDPDPVGVSPSPGPKTSITRPGRSARVKIEEPEFAPLEEVVGNWKSIPGSAFPREVTLNSRVSYKITGGTASLPEGSKVFALSGDGGLLSIARTSKSKPLVQVEIDKTDFKEVLAGVYEKFKDKKRRELAVIRQQTDEQIVPDEPTGPEDVAIIDRPFDPKPGQATRANTPLPAKMRNFDEKTKAIIGDPPVQYVDGTVPAMVRSMESGQVKEITRDIIQYWGRMHVETIEGQPYWVCSVDYTAGTIFGIFPTQAKALMRNGKVVKWIYSGTGEPVP